MPPPKKPAARRQGHAGTKDLASLAPKPVVVSGGFGLPAMPEPDDSWLPQIREQWVTLWGSDLSGDFEQTDLPSLFRCFEWRDEQMRCRIRARVLREQADAEPTVEGSKGQPVASPLYGIAAEAEQQALAIEGRIVALEDRLALSPKARLTLGVTVQKGASLAAQNAALALAIQEAMRGATDPRTAGGEPAAEVG